MVRLQFSTWKLFDVHVKELTLQKLFNRMTNHVILSFEKGSSRIGREPCIQILLLGQINKKEPLKHEDKH